MTTIAPPASRNDPCPCGSGKRYKHCHGSDAPSASAAPEAPPASADPIERARAALRAGQARDAAALVVHAADAGALDAMRVLAEALRTIDPAASRARWDRVLAAAPGDAEALFFLGEFARDDGDYALAIERFEQALETAPGHPALLTNLGLALEKRGDYERARACFEQVLAATPDDLNAIANLAQNLYQQRRYKEAVPWFDRVIARMPTAPAAIWANRGVSQRLTGNAAAAEQSLARATRLAPEEPAPWRDLGFARAELAQWGPAAVALDRALALDPHDLSALSMLVHVGSHECVWDRHEERVATLLEAARQGETRPRAPTLGDFIVPFTYLAIADDPLAERWVARAWAESQILPTTGPRPFRDLDKPRLRLGFLSPDLHSHPVGRLIVGLFERLDRGRFEVYAYAAGKDVRDATRERIVAAVDKFASFPEIDAFEIAGAMQADRIDVAFDLTGYTANSVLSVLSLRPAPVQVNFLGYTGTLGSPAIDWIITDRYCVPPDRAGAVDERPLYVDPCYLPNDASRRIDDPPPSRAEFKLPEDAMVYCAVLAPYKIQPERFDAWMRVLREVDGSLLWLRRLSSPAAGRLGERAEALGVDPARLRYAPGIPVPAYLARFRRADLFLDTAPFGSHTTVNDALYAGLPVLAQAGNTFASRASASQVIAAGLPELVASSLDEYVEIAIALGRDRPRLAAMAATLRERRASLALFDLDAYTRRFEEAIERAWRETPLD